VYVKLKILDSPFHLFEPLVELATASIMYSMRANKFQVQVPAHAVLK
jgi:hypothetical protein